MNNISSSANHNPVRAPSALRQPVLIDLVELYCKSRYWIIYKPPVHVLAEITGMDAALVDAF